jgi:anti-sigma28 factor (negative regulator of flagellin synthesis)
VTHRPEREAPARGERIRMIEERIRRGDYRIPAEAVADALIDWYRRAEPDERANRP